MSSYGDIFRRCDSQQTEESSSLSSWQGVLASFSHARNRQFLAPFNPAFRSPPALQPPSLFDKTRRPALPRPSTRSFCILYSRASPASSHLSFSHPSHCESSRSLRFVPVFSSSCCFHLIPSLTTFPSFLPCHHAYLCSFYYAIMLALLLSCPQPHLFFFFFSLSFSLSLFSFLFSLLKLSLLTHFNFLASIFPSPSQTILSSVSLTSQYSFTNVFYFTRSSFFYRDFLVFFSPPLIYSLCKLPFHLYPFYFSFLSLFFCYCQHI